MEVPGVWEQNKGVGAACSMGTEVSLPRIKVLGLRHSSEKLQIMSE